MEFDAFFAKVFRHMDRVFEKLVLTVSNMTPLLLKVEEILVKSRTRKAERLTCYYHHWEMKLFFAIGKLILDNIINGKVHNHS